jgi:hypothetical protein
MSSSVVIANMVETRRQPGSVMAAAVGFYFALRYSTEYLFFQSDPRAGAAFSVGLNFFVFAVVLFHSLGPAVNTLRSTLKVPSSGGRLSVVRPLQFCLERDRLGARRFCLLVWRGR